MLLKIYVFIYKMDSPRALRSSPRFMSMTKDARRQRSPPPEEPKERISWDDYFMKAATLASVSGLHVID